MKLNSNRFLIILDVILIAKYVVRLKRVSFFSAFNLTDFVVFWIHLMIQFTIWKQSSSNISSMYCFYCLKDFRGIVIAW
jgi:hypothetical protein